MKINLFKQLAIIGLFSIALSSCSKDEINIYTPPQNEASDLVNLEETLAGLWVEEQTTESTGEVIKPIDPSIFIDFDGSDLTLTYVVNGKVTADMVSYSGDYPREELPKALSLASNVIELFNEMTKERIFYLPNFDQVFLSDSESGALTAFKREL